MIIILATYQVFVICVICVIDLRLLLRNFNWQCLSLILCNFTILISSWLLEIIRWMLIIHKIAETLLSFGKWKKQNVTWGYRPFPGDLMFLADGNYLHSSLLSRVPWVIHKCFDRSMKVGPFLGNHDRPTDWTTDLRTLGTIVKLYFQ